RRAEGHRPASGARWRSLRWWYDGDRVLAALMGFVVLYYVVQPGIFQGKGSGDGIIDFLFLPSLVTHGTLDIRRADADAHFWVMPVINGRMTNHFPIGPPILWSPMYLLSLGIEKIVRPFGRLRGQPFGVNAFSYWMCGLATLLWSLVGI